MSQARTDRRLIGTPVDRVEGRLKVTGGARYAAELKIIGAEALAIDVGQVRSELGDSTLPPAAVHGGSATTASVGSAVHEACLAVRAKVLALASNDPRSPLHAFAAHFVEVRVDPELGVVRVSRVMTACGGGRIMNEKTARTQLTGAVVGGLGMALTEETVMDHRMGVL